MRMHMTRRYLYPGTRRIEIVAALYAAGFGLHALYLKTMWGSAGLSWAGVENGLAVARFLVTVSLLHGLAIRVNGRAGILSPLLRAVCMALFAGFFGGLAAAWTGTSAGYTYSVVAVGMTIGALNAFNDTVTALRGALLKWI